MSNWPPGPMRERGPANIHWGRQNKGETVGRTAKGSPIQRLTPDIETILMQGKPRSIRDPLHDVPGTRKRRGV